MPHQPDDVYSLEGVERQRIFFTPLPFEGGSEPSDISRLEGRVCACRCCGAAQAQAYAARPLSSDFLRTSPNHLTNRMRDSKMWIASRRLLTLDRKITSALPGEGDPSHSASPDFPSYRTSPDSRAPSAAQRSSQQSP